MSRIRTVKPELFKHETLFDAERATKLPLRLAFIGLLTCCDREGRFKWRPGRLKLDLLPYDDINVSEILDAFVVYGFVDKYEYQGNWYGCIPSWSKHQYVNHREMASEIPEPNKASQIINHKNANKNVLATEQNTTSLVENLQSYQNKATEKTYLDNIVNFVTPAAVDTSQSYHNNIGQNATINLVINDEVKQATISQNLVEQASKLSRACPGNAHLCPGTPGGNMERNMEGNMEGNMIVDKLAALRVSNKTVVDILKDPAKKHLEPTSKNNLLTSKIINVESQEVDHFQLVKTNNNQDINLVNQQQPIKQDSRLSESFRANDQKLQDSDNKILHRDPVDSVSKYLANNLLKHFDDQTADVAGSKQKISKTQFGELLDLLKKPRQYQQFLKINDTVGSLTNLDQYLAGNAINCKPLKQTNSDEKQRVTEQSQIATENTNLSEESSSNNDNQADLLQDPEKFLQSSTNCLKPLLNITENNLNKIKDSKASCDLSSPSVINICYIVQDKSGATLNNKLRQNYQNTEVMHANELLPIDVINYYENNKLTIASNLNASKDHKNIKDLQCALLNTNIKDHVVNDNYNQCY